MQWESTASRYVLYSRSAYSQTSHSPYSSSTKRRLSNTSDDRPAPALRQDSHALPNELQLLLRQYETQWQRVKSQNDMASAVLQPEDMRQLLARVSAAIRQASDTSAELTQQLLTYLSNQLAADDPEELPDEPTSALLAIQSEIWERCLQLLLLKA